MVCRAGMARRGSEDERYRHRLAEAIAGVAYTELDLSHLTNHREPQGRRRAAKVTAANKRKGNGN